MTLIPLPRQTPPAFVLGLLIEVEHPAAGTRRMRVRGELDMATAPLLGWALDRAVEDRGRVEVDLSDLAFCDVVGVTALEQARRRLAARGCRLTFSGIAPLRLLSSVPGLFELPPLDGHAGPVRLRPSSRRGLPDPARPVVELDGARPDG